MQQIRVVEVLAALSLTTDLASGVPFEKGLRTCAVADAFAAALDLGPLQRRVVFQCALLRSIGCTAHAPENAAMFGDDTAFQAALKVLDPGDPVVFGSQLASFGAWAGTDANAAMSARFMEAAPTVGPYAGRAGCEVSRALGPRLGLAAETIEALDDVYERWDGLGIPEGRSGTAISLAGRIVHVAEQAVLAYTSRGRSAAVDEVRRRSGGHLDPALAAQFADHCAEVLAPLDETDALAAVIAREPAPTATIPLDELDRLCGALAVVADLKSTYSVGHSMRVAELAAAAATVAGLSAQRCTLLRCAGLVHNVGAVVVPSALLDIAHRVGAAELERIRLHTYWTERILERCPALTMLAALSGPAAAQHQEYAASGYQSWAEEPHRSASFDARSASFDARVLEAAEVFASLTEPRPGRPPLSASKSASELNRKSARRMLDPEACAAVIEGAGLPRPRARRPCGLTDRELDILRLAARGLSNQQIADEVVISARTVGHHLSHIYDKTGLRTRAGVAVFAAEHGLLPEMHR